MEKSIRSNMANTGLQKQINKMLSRKSQHIATTNGCVCINNVGSGNDIVERDRKSRPLKRFKVYCTFMLQKQASEKFFVCLFVFC